MTLRLLHSADWQLGRSFVGMPPESAGIVREARFEAVRTLARLAREGEVDAILVAGDVFDDNLVGGGTCARALAAMRGFAGLWILLPGNHDAATAAGVWSRLRRSGLPDQVVIADEAAPIPLLDGRLVVLPAPLTVRRVAEDLTAWMDSAATPPGAVRVGLAHGCLRGRLPGEADATNPIAADRASSARLDYLALGDWHGTLAIDARTWYAGTPEPDRFTTNDAGQALLVELDGPGVLPRVEALPTGALAWRSVTVDCTGLDPTTAEAVLTAAMPPVDARHRMLLRLRLEGRVGLASRAALGMVTERLAGELLWLDLLADDLAAEPDEADLRELARSPATAAAAAVLQARATSGPEADRAVAAHALRLLYAEAAALEPPG